MSAPARVSNGLEQGNVGSADSGRIDICAITVGRPVELLSDHSQKNELRLRLVGHLKPAEQWRAPKRGPEKTLSAGHGTKKEATKPRLEITARCRRTSLRRLIHH